MEDLKILGRVYDNLFVAHFNDLIGLKVIKKQYEEEVAKIKSRTKEMRNEIFSHINSFTHRIQILEGE